ncbi:hypothetical protein EC973_004869 [Apophysomyces ossiformis]|uniref:MYND-type domain-containing protein n=1 Tax=Apophysomyces ossiformis TaxID=679940 RepID=A0A8H7BFG7_9FUNG|nr:hypothetical protein EC973_004869 [Apophysomyces ossiformis]
MREPNLCFPGQSRAAVCITSALYDRRALDCTATLPLINSLTHLVYLTSTSPRIREILVLDGGLERLVRILSPQTQYSDRRSLWKWSLAFHCVVNVGVRGTEQIRTRVVEAGMIPVVLTVLENFLRALEIARQENQRQQDKRTPAFITESSRRSMTSREFRPSQTPSNGTVTNDHSSAPSTASTNQVFPPTVLIQSSPRTTSPCTNPLTPSIPTARNENTALHAHRPSSRTISPVSVRRSTFPYVKINSAQRRQNRIHREPIRPSQNSHDPRAPNIDNVFYREEDILLSLQLLAYLSKYSHIRTLFLTAYDQNVFSVVEKFAQRYHPSAIQHWASVIMRNACRKDETRGGVRRCANMHCGQWERQPREFAKCRRCRKAKYCSKECQSKAWGDGHRWWCVERQPTVTREGDQSITVLGTGRAGSPVSQNMVVPAQDTGHQPTTAMNPTVNRNSPGLDDVVATDVPTPPSHAHNDMAMQTGGHTTTDSSETAGILMEMGVSMEL